MKKLITVFLLSPLFSFSQDKNIFIKIEARPTDPRKGYTFEIYKTNDEIMIEYKKVDSIRKISFSDEDKEVISWLIKKTDLDSLAKDSIDFYQRKLDAIKEANTFYKVDSIFIYKTTHKAYFKLLIDIIKTSDSALVAPQEKIIANTYCFFTISEAGNKEIRTFYIECLAPKIFPVLTKLVDDSNAIVRAHKEVREKKIKQLQF